MGIPEGRNPINPKIEAKDIPNLATEEALGPVLRTAIVTCLVYEGNLSIPSYEFCCFSAFRTIPEISGSEIAFQYLVVLLVLLLRLLNFLP
jgi:hypothetical protein